MPTTTVSATVDRNIVKGLYRYIGNTNETTDLDVKVIHQYQNDIGQPGEIIVKNFTIPKEAIQSEGVANISDVVQTVEFHVVNLKYIENLVVEVTETRDNVATSTRASVLDGNDITVPPLPNNPQESRTHEENQPPQISQKPQDNVVKPEPSMLPILYDISRDGFNLVSFSKRVYLDAVEQKFKTQEYNTVVDAIFIENSIQNFLVNHNFSDSSNSVPGSFNVHAPGFITTYQMKESNDIPETFIWKIRSSNPNTFNAFNTLSVRYEPKTAIPSGLLHLNLSVYYQLASDFGIQPFSDFTYTVNFFDSNEEHIASQTSPLITLMPQDSKWHLMQATFSSIPLTAHYFNFSITTSEINVTDPFVLQLYLPQAEASAFATTRALSSRILDQIKTTELDLNSPLYLKLKTIHNLGPSSIRGFFDSTSALKDGIQFYGSNNRMYFKKVDGSGLAYIAEVSDVITNLNEGDDVEYGVYLDGLVVEFYINNILLSSHTTSGYTLDQQSVTALIGSLGYANTTLNSELKDFGVYRVKP
jgi:hypothetical protein